VNWIFLQKATFGDRIIKWFILGDKGGNMSSQKSLAAKLVDSLVDIQMRFEEYIQSHQIESYLERPHPLALLDGNPQKIPETKYRIKKDTPKQKRIHQKLIGDLQLWANDVEYLWDYVPEEVEAQLSDLVKKITFSILAPRISGSRNSFSKVIEELQNFCNRFYESLNEVIALSSPCLIFIIDTCAIIDCPDIEKMVVFNADVKMKFVMPSTTIIELEDLKSSKRDAVFRRKLTKAINYINGLYLLGDVLEGVRLSDGRIVKMIAQEPKFDTLPEYLDPEVQDDRIIASAIIQHRKNPLCIVVLISNDISMQNKAQLANIYIQKAPKLNSDHES
jgi:PIN domain